MPHTIALVACVSQNDLARTPAPLHLPLVPQGLHLRRPQYRDILCFKKHSWAGCSMMVSNMAADSPWAIAKHAVFAAP